MKLQTTLYDTYLEVFYKPKSKRNYSTIKFEQLSEHESRKFIDPLLGLLNISYTNIRFDPSCSEFRIYSAKEEKVRAVDIQVMVMDSQQESESNIFEIV